MHSEYLVTIRGLGSWQAEQIFQAAEAIFINMDLGNGFPVLLGLPASQQPEHQQTKGPHVQGWCGLILPLGYPINGQLWWLQTSSTPAHELCAATCHIMPLTAHGTLYVQLWLAQLQA